jgi:ABC-type multidrug transport system ATPase subunit
MYSHRLSTIMRADRIIVMKDGSIIEHGSHDGLLRLKGKYFDLWANQIQLLHPDDNSNKNSDVKPESKLERSRSSSPFKDEANIKSSRSRSKSLQKNKIGGEPSGSRSKSPHKDSASVVSSRSRSMSPQKDKAGILNDLDPERNLVGLLKLAELSKITEEDSQSVDDESKTTKVSIRNSRDKHMLIKRSILS